MNVRSSEINATRINTRLEIFLAKTLRNEHVDYYEQEPCVELIKKKYNIFTKYPYRILIVCKDRVIITDNPPKKENLNNFICFNDILEIKAVSTITIELFFFFFFKRSILTYWP
jgi:hypothetical protein